MDKRKQDPPARNELALVGGEGPDENSLHYDTRLLLQSSKEEIIEWKSVHGMPNATIRKEPVKKKHKSKNAKYGYLTLYRFATKCHIVLMSVGVLAAIASGLCVPGMVIYFGELTNTMVAIDLINQEEAFIETNHTLEGLDCFSATKRNLSEIKNIENVTNIKHAVKKAINQFTFGHSLFALVFGLLSCLYFICWYLPAEFMVMKMRKEYFKALLRMDTKWHDLHCDTDFGSQLLEHTALVRDGIGQGIPAGIDLCFMFLFSCINAFWHGWALTLIASISIPMFLFASTMVTLADSAKALADQKSFSVANALAEEVIVSIRTVMIYNAQRNELRRFKHELNLSSKGLFHRCLVTAVCNGLVWFLTYANYALTFWFGAHWVLHDRVCTDQERPDKYDAGDLIIVFFSIMFGAINVGLALPTWEAINIARGNGKEIFEIIDTKPEVDSLSEEGIMKEERAKGAFKFQDVDFIYSTRPNWPILKGFSAVVEPGSTVAFVGASGCGKSTILKLIMKEYVPDSGSVELDGIDTRDWNTQWLRSQIGVVTHTPCLFNMSIEENVRLGKPDATFEEIRNACMKANAHNFITDLKDGYHTQVGIYGGKLSLGEKQRISIARTLLKNPSILILDAPTSALDTESGELVQEALEEASKLRTTFIVAHRLSSIINADKIFVMDSGRVVEEGTYSELMLMKGLFFKMVTKQEESPEMIQTRSDTHSAYSAVSKKSDLSIRSKRNASAMQQRVLKYTRTAILNKGRTHRQRKTTINVVMPKDVDGPPKKKSDNRVRSEESDDIETKDEPIKEQKIEIGTRLRAPTISHSNDSIDIDWEEKMRIEENELKLERRINKAPVDKTDIDRISVCNAICFSSKSSSCLIFVGTVTSIIMGAILPVYGVIFGEIIAVLSQVDMEDAKEEITLLSSMMVIVGVVAAVATCIQGMTLSVASYRTVKKIRKVLFVSILRQEMAWFEHPENSLSALSNRLSSDAANVEGIILSVYGTFVQCAATVLSSVFFSFYESIVLSLYAIGLVPMVILFTLLDGLLSKIHEDKKAASNEEMLEVITEAFQNRESVMTLQLENYYLDKFEECLHRSTNSLWPLTIGRTLAYGLAQAGGFGAYSLCMYAAGHALDQEELNYEKILKVGDALIFGLFTIGSQLAVIPSMMHAIESARLIIQIVNRTPLIKYDVGGENLTSCSGDMAFRNVEFSYPLEPEVKALQKLNFRMDGSGKLYALVGPSGSGKSTILSLLMRFHEAKKGVVEFCGYDIKSLNCSSLRRFIALVEQEPRLFDRTIEDNITFGSESRHVDMDEVVEAAQEANIHDFIMTLPEKYSTRVGPSGERLSDGQRQAISIARALYTKAPIILLDEPTSSLDPESEQHFNDSFEYARIGKTCVYIPQRLATIKHADKIFVFGHGRVVEEGTHEELLSRNGMYAQLFEQQKFK